MAAKKKKTASKKSQRTPTRRAAPRQPAVSFEADLAALPEDAGHQDPPIPADVMLVEAARAAAAAKGARTVLGRLPEFDLRWVDQLPALICMGQDANSNWDTHRFARSLGTGRTKDRKAAEALRARVLAAGRYLFRRHPDVVLELDRIAEGQGLPDLIADLRDLHRLTHGHRDVWAQDVALPQGALDSLEPLANRLETLPEQDSARVAREGRNRVFALLGQWLEEVRMAARYLFATDPVKLKPFLSTHAAQLRSRTRARAAVQARKAANTPLMPV